MEGLPLDRLGEEKKMNLGNESENLDTASTPVPTKRRLGRLNKLMGLALFGIIALSGAVWFVFASNVNSRRDVMSNTMTSANSHHQISFTLSALNTFATGEQIAIQFPAGFTLVGTWAAADFSLTDGTARTIAGIAQGGGVSSVVCPDAANNIGVAIDTTAKIFRFLPCGGSFTASAANAGVTLSIDGTTPDGTLANPGAPGSFEINIPNAAGDCTTIGDVCSIGVAVVNQATVSISASISAVCGNNVVEAGEQCDDGNTANGDGCSAACTIEGGGGPGGPPPDTTPPVITNVQAINITRFAARIIWTTDENSTSLVRYGLTAPAYGSTAQDPAYLMSHGLNLSSLNEGTTYHFQVCSTDSPGNQACSSDYTFTTLDETPPVITNVQVTGITTTGATVTWTTDENATTFVDYDTDGLPYVSTAGVATPRVTSHSVTLSGLTPGLTYHYRVRSGDAANNEAFTSDATFATVSPPDSTPPVITNVQVTGITATGATVTWTTNENATSSTDYDTDGAPYASTAGAAVPLVTSHSVILAGLTENTTYHYRVRSADASANEATTADATFKTLDVTPPVITNVQVTSITATGARITWTTNEAADSTVNYGLTTAYGSTKTEAAPVTAHVTDLTGLTPNTTYNFLVKSKDAGNNEATSGNFTFKTLLPAPPVISNVHVTNITQTTARILWDTSTSSNSTVNYGLTITYGDTQTNPAMATANHLVSLSGLKKGRTYNFRVRSTDAYGQETVSGNYTFNTLPDNTPPANVSNFTATPGDSIINLAWINPTDTDFQGVKVLRKTNAYPTGPTDGTVVYEGAGTNHADNTVTNGVTYYFAIYAFDDVPNYSSGAVASATPLGPADTTPPGNVSNFTATPGNALVTLSWINPPDADFQGVKIIRKALSCPATMNDGTLVYEGASTGLVDTPVANGTLYCYKAYSFDAIPNYSSGVEATATPFAPPDITPPGPVTNLAAVAGNTAVQLTWVNPGDADWAGTRLVRKAGSAPTGPNDGTVIFDAVGDNKLDSGLTNGTTYYYAAYAYDSSANMAAPAFTSATPQASAPPPPPPACTDTDGGINYDVKGTATESGGQTETDSCAGGGKLKEIYCDASNKISQDMHDCGSGYRCSDGRCMVETFVPNQAVCGNGLCEANENSINCVQDCPVTPATPPVQPEAPPAPPSQQIRIGDIEYYATVGQLRLQVTQGSYIQVYPQMTVRVYVPDRATSKPVKNAFVNFLGSSYAMTLTKSWETTLAAPSALGDHPLQIVVNYQDDTSDSVNAFLRVVAFGQTYENISGGTAGVSGARVSLYVDTGGGNYGLWDGTTYGEQNPQTSGDAGRFAFIVTPGRYKLVAEKDGYRTNSTMPFDITTENVISRRLELIALPPPIKELTDILAGPSTGGQKAAAVATAISEQVGYAAKSGYADVQEYISSPIIEQQVSTTAAPAATAVAIINVAAVGTAAATGIPYLVYLMSLLAHPGLLFGRRKRKKWGIIYNSLSKRPVDLAIVRLLDANTNRVLRSAVTDKDGRYFFIVHAGEFKLSVTKAGFVFPTAYLKDEHEDGDWLDLYHGETIKVTESTTITANIPVDPITVERTERTITWIGIARRLQNSIAVLSILAMLVVTLISPTKLVIGLLVLNVITYMIFRRLSVTAKPKNWGIVYDKITGKPIRNALARVFESKYNKLLETQVTDSRGRYSFLVGRNVYYVTFEKPGYQKEQKGPVDLLTAKKIEGVISVDVHLQPVSAAGAPGVGKGETPATKPPEATPPATTPSEPTPTPNLPATVAPPPPSVVVPPPAAAPDRPVLERGAEPPVVPPAAPPPTEGQLPVPPTVSKPAAEAKVPWELSLLRKNTGLAKAVEAVKQAENAPKAISSPSESSPFFPERSAAESRGGPSMSSTGSPQAQVGSERMIADQGAGQVPNLGVAISSSLQKQAETPLVEDASHAHSDIPQLTDDSGHKQNSP